MEHPLRTQARQYHHTAERGLERPEKFTPESLFQLTALAVEGYWLAWLEQRGEFPSHHTFGHLLKAAANHSPVPDHLRRRVLAFDRFQKLCEWVPVDPKKPTRDDIPELLAVAAEVAVFTA